MRRRTAHLAASPSVEPINVTPLIDVVMCLIIFFLIVGKLAANEKARVQLPGTTIGAVAERQDAVTVTVARTVAQGKVIATIAVDGQPAADGPDLLRLLQERLEAQARMEAFRARSSQPRPISAGKVTVRADKDLHYQAVEPVLSACAQLGINKVDYATARVEAGRATP